MKNRLLIIIIFLPCLILDGILLFIIYIPLYIIFNRNLTKSKSLFEILQNKIEKL